MNRQQELFDGLMFPMEYIYQNHDRKSHRKYVSHIGGYLLDYMNAELQARAGLLRPTAKFLPVHNWTYSCMLRELETKLEEFAVPNSSKRNRLG